ncbi:prospore membrane adapter protein Spo71p [Trichomonascus vanleenenianus]|uniref:Spo71p n=1 Tax=Trichomonascus vanleenenianus TaxID=2268995 RepID=UPI003ECA2446
MIRTKRSTFFKALGADRSSESIGESTGRGELGELLSSWDKESGLIPKDSYTALRLYNATPVSAFKESRVYVIGPIPIEWIRKNRQVWGKRRYALMRSMMPKASTLKRFAGRQYHKARERGPRSSIGELNDNAMKQLEMARTHTASSAPNSDPALALGAETEGEERIDDHRDALSAPGTIETYSEGENVSSHTLGSMDRAPLLDTSLRSHHGSENIYGSSSHGQSELLPPIGRSPLLGSDISVKSRSLSPLNDSAEFLTAYDDPLSAENPLSASPKAYESLRIPLRSSRQHSEVSMSSFVTAQQSLPSTNGFASIDGRSESSTPKGSINDGLEDTQEGAKGSTSTYNAPAQLSLTPTTMTSLGQVETATENALRSAEFESDIESVSTVRQVTRMPSLNLSKVSASNQLSSILKNTHSKESQVKDEPLPRKRDMIKQAGVKFPHNIAETALQMTGRTASAVHRHGHRVKNKGTILLNTRRFLRKKKTGEIIRIEKMLVTVQQTESKFLSSDFNEMEFTETRMLERWKEYLVVARTTGNDEKPIALQFYQSRGVARIEGKTKPKSKLDVHIGHDFNVNLFSSLDKTLALWYPGERGSTVYIMRSRSVHSALAWLALLASVIGIQRDTVVNVRVPDLGVSADVQLSNHELNKMLEMKRDPMVCVRDVVSYRATPSRTVAHFFTRTLDCLKEIDEMKKVIEKEWEGKVKLGLAWRRYDRLEWMFDNNETQMQASWAMVRTHDLELRPKTTYTRTITLEDGSRMEEPIPVEGFVTRLSSWNGRLQPNQLFVKRIYLHTHDHLLFYSPVMRSLPPRPEMGFSSPIDLENDNIDEIAASIPITYDVSPYQLDDVTGEIQWLKYNPERDTPVSFAERFEKFDKAALFEMQRKVASIQKSDGFIDLTEVKHIRAVDDALIDSVTQRAMTTTGLRGRICEIVLEKTGLSLKLKAHDSFTRDQWVFRLNKLMKYWKERLNQDTQRRDAVRQKNLDSLHIDEDMDAIVGETAPKWETDRGFTDPLMYHTSGMSWGRAIHVKGFVYQKPRKYASFTLYYAILCHGELILYHPFERDSSGNIQPRVSYRRAQNIALEDCYVYSGPITGTDLLRRDRWFDKNDPGRHALPRVYEDGWKSGEEETLRCFALWFGRKKVVSKPSKKDNRSQSAGGGLQRVTRLGVSGRSMVFLTRSRQERDMWVTALNIELGRLAEADSYDEIILR